MSASVRLFSTLNSGAARYRVIDHPPEGETAAASRLRGHPLASAAKCLVVRVKITKKTGRYVLAVVPGDRRVDLDRIRDMFDGVSVYFATREIAELLSGCVSGSIIPFSFDPDLQLVVDPDLLLCEEIYFNAARLDLSVAVNTTDWVALSNPRVEPIALPLEVVATG
jgi:Ala-tRNA(Pro) deacylase